MSMSTFLSSHFRDKIPQCYFVLPVHTNRNDNQCRCWKRFRDPGCVLQICQPYARHTHLIFESLDKVRFAGLSSSFHKSGKVGERKMSRVYRVHSCKSRNIFDHFQDLKCELLRFMWGMAGVTLGVYNITQDLNIPLIAQPELFSFLALVSWGQVNNSLAILLSP